MSSLSDRLTQTNRRKPAPPARASGMRAALFLAFAVIAALGAGLLFKSYLDRGQAGAGPATEKVVVAAMEIPPATALRAELLTTIDWPKASLPAGAFRDPKALEGKILVTALLKGEPILAPRVAAAEAGEGLAAILPGDMRAVAVRVDDVVGVAGFIHPGDSVDVIVTIKAEEGSDVPPTSKVILQNVRVLAVGKELDRKSGRSVEKAVPVTVATLMVNSPDSERLALASTKGQILLALRNRGDLGLIETPGVIPADLLEGTHDATPPEVAETLPPPPPPLPAVAQGAQAKPRPVAAKKAVAPKPAPAPQSHQVEILRGDLFETRKFSPQEQKP